MSTRNVPQIASLLTSSLSEQRRLRFKSLWRIIFRLSVK